MGSHAALLARGILWQGHLNDMAEGDYFVQLMQARPPVLLELQNGKAGGRCKAHDQTCRQEVWCERAGTY